MTVRHGSVTSGELVNTILFGCIMCQSDLLLSRKSSQRCSRNIAVLALRDQGCCMTSGIREHHQAERSDLARVSSHLCSRIVRVVGDLLPPYFPFWRRFFSVHCARLDSVTFALSPSTSTQMPRVTNIIIGCGAGAVGRTGSTNRAVGNNAE